MTKNVLIVDDDHGLLLSLAEGMIPFREAFHVVTAKDGVEALEKLGGSPFSLVVTDLRMPRMDGLTLLVHIMDHYPDIPVMVMTGYLAPQLEKVAREGGAVEFIQKPFQTGELARRILAVLKDEADGGTLHGISVSMFLQLIQMEQKSCTLRVVNKGSGSRGVLFFRDGELLDARAADLQGEAAAHEISSWDGVTIAIQNKCLQKERRIRSDLFTILLESMRLRDESADLQTPATPRAALETKPVQAPKGGSPDRDDLGELRRTLSERLGPRSKMDRIAFDDAWDPLLSELARIGKAFGAGDLKLGYIDKGGPAHVILIPGRRTTVITVDPTCPRDRILQVLRER
jgi:CheY-like chemotaxis protein